MLMWSVEKFRTAFEVILCKESFDLIAQRTQKDLFFFTTTAIALFSPFEKLSWAYEWIFHKQNRWSSTRVTFCSDSSKASSSRNLILVEETFSWRFVAGFIFGNFFFPLNENLWALGSGYVYDEFMFKHKYEFSRANCRPSIEREQE